MGNSYTSLSTEDPQDVLLNNKAGIKSSVSMFLKKPPQKRRSIHTDSVAALTSVRSGMVLTGSRDKSIALNNIDNGETTMRWLGHGAEITKLAYKNLSGRHYVLSASRDDSIRLWHFNTSAAIRQYDGHTIGVTGLAVGEDTHFYSGSRDTTVRQWDVETGQQVRAAQQSRNLVTHMCYNNVTKTIAQSSEDKSLRIWDAHNLTVAHSFNKKNNIQTHCEFLPDGLTVFSCSNGFNGDGCEITLYDVRTHKILREYRGHEESVTSVCHVHNQTFGPKKLMLSTSYDRSVRLWNIEDGNCVWRYESQDSVGLLASLAFSDGNIIVTGQEGLIVHLQLLGRAGRPLLRCVSYYVQCQLGALPELDLNTK